MIGVALAVHILSVGDSPGTLASVVLYTATLCRVLHAVAYVCKLQLFRTIFFVIALVCAGLLAFQLLLSA